jgi:transposase
MKPELWHPPLELSDCEKEIISRIRRAKLFVFLRKVRHQLFDDQFQEELAQIYQKNPTCAIKMEQIILPAQLKSLKY